MEQINIAETFRQNNTATAVKFVMIMAVIFLMTFIITIFPMSVTFMFFAAPALIMNIGWLMFARAL